MSCGRAAFSGAAALLATACASALHEPPPIAALAPHATGGRSVDDLMHAADAAWARRGEPGQVSVAQGLYLDAAADDERRVDGLLGAMRAMTYRIEHEGDAGLRAHLAEQEVELGQWCQRRAPSDPACDYRLALGLGQEARELPSTGRDALGKMVPLLRRAIAAAPGLDSAGPHRVLALVLMRAPGWPLGPGDPEVALEEARTAVHLYPDAPENQLALGEALGKNDQPGPARAAYQRALELAAAAREAGDPDAEHLFSDARAGIERYRAR